MLNVAALTVMIAALEIIVKGRESMYSFIKKSSLMLAGVMATGLATAGGTVGLDLSSDAVRLQVSNVANMSADTEVEWDAGFLRVEADNGGPSRSLVTGTLRSVGDAGIAHHQVNAALGVRAFWLNGGGFDAQALGVGGELSARLQGMDRLVFSGYAYYAPQIISFGDAEAFLEWGGNVGYQVLRNGEVFLGFRQVKVEPTQGPDLTMDTGFHLGMRFGF